MKDREDQKGFSLDELLIVLAIMAVLGVAAVSVVGAVSGFRLNGVRSVLIVPYRRAK